MQQIREVVGGLSQSLERRGKKLGTCSSAMGSYRRVLSNGSHFCILKSLGRVRTTSSKALILLHQSAEDEALSSLPHAPSPVCNPFPYRESGPTNLSRAPNHPCAQLPTPNTIPSQPILKKLFSLLVFESGLRPLRSFLLTSVIFLSTQHNACCLLAWFSLICSLSPLPD